MKTMQTFLQDLRFGFVMLLRKPGFTALAILTLALGIGANTAIFSVINATLFRPLPYPAEKQIVVLQEVKADQQGSEKFGNGASYLNFLDWREQSKSFDSLAIVQADEVTLTGEGEPARIRTAVTSADIFKVLGIQPLLGRAFQVEEELPGSAEGLNSVILSHSFWQQRFDSERKIVGRKIMLDNQPFNVVGVMPAGVFPLQQEPIDCWVTTANGGDAKKKGTMNGSRGYRAYAAVLARMKPNVTVQQAQAEMNSLAQGLREKYPDANAGQNIRVSQLRELIVGKTRPLLWLLLGIVAAVLLIACANVVNLLLARATVRQKEMVIRAALGASRWHIMRHLLTESLLIALAGGVLGLVISLWGVDLLVLMLPAEVPRITGLTPDWRVFLFTIAAAILTGVLCGLLPALSAVSYDLSQAMKDGGRNNTSGLSRNRFRNGLVISEIAIALILLVGAGLLLKSFVRLQSVDPGFKAENILTAKIVLPHERYQKPPATQAFYHTLLERLQQLPGVAQVSIAQSIPLTQNDNGTNLEIVGQPFPQGRTEEARLRFIGLNYFQTIGIPQGAGRDFTDRDDAQAPPVVIINEAFVRKYFQGEDPLGKKLKLGWGGDEAKEIVGVVGNVRHRGLDDQARPEMYVPQAQFATNDMTLMIRTKTAPESMAAVVTAKVKELDPELPVTEIKTLAQYRADSVALPRFNTFILLLFAGLALSLTMIGLYGVIAYSVAQRTNEIGVRMTLGAQPADILTMVLQQGMKLAGAGVLIGLVGAVGITRVMKSWLFEVSTTDPLTFFAVAALLTLVALAASFIPAYKATKVDLLVALRYE